MRRPLLPLTLAAFVIVVSHGTILPPEGLREVHATCAAYRDFAPSVTCRLVSSPLR